MTSRQPPTAVARVRSQVRSPGICCGQSGTEAGFFRVLWSPLPVLIPPNAPSGAHTTGQLMADAPSAPSLTTPHEKKVYRLQFKLQYIRKVSQMDSAIKEALQS
jgi:hypothetical protein